MGDLKFALARGDVGFGQCRAVVGRVVAGWEEGTLEGWGTWPPDSEPSEKSEHNGLGTAANGVPNGVPPPRINGVSTMTTTTTNTTTITTNGVHHAEDPNEAWGWEGGSKADRTHLGSLLDDCLAFGQC